MQFIDVKTVLTEEDLTQVEKDLSFKFPIDLRRHYLKWNGGYPMKNIFMKNDECFSIHEFLPIKYGHENALFEDTYVDLLQGNDWFPKYLVPIAIDSSGDYFCYAVDGDNVGGIYFYQSDYCDDPSRAIVFLSKSLEHFLNGLVQE